MAAASAADTAIVDGQLVFYNHPDNAWVLGTVTGALDPKKGYTVKDKENGGATVQVMPANIYPIMNEAILQEDVQDLLLLSELHQSTLLNTLRLRYHQDVVYTYIGPIVIAINPFNYNIPWYKDDFMPNYLVEGPIIQKNKPHSWSVAHNTYYEMTSDRQNQCVLVSGESGAGKTEAVKIVIKYIRGLMGKLAKDDAHRDHLNEINHRILLASPILESFGNAKTGRNDNSSRFGKFLQLEFDGNGFIKGSFAIPYLLEKSRVVTSAQGERIYHSFYQVAKGKDAAKYTLGDPKTYPSLMAGGSLDNASMEDAEGDDLSYRMTNEAYAVCGLSLDEADASWRVLAAILRLARCVFVPSGEASATWGNGTEADVDAAAGLLRLQPEDLKREMLQTRGEVRGEVFVMDHTPEQAAIIRHSLVQSVYNGLFLWLFDRINAGTQAPDREMWIGLLDIFGFEDFKVNSFEQLCINLANETLQNHYNDFIFSKDMEECKSEGIDITDVAFVDNKPTCDLLTGKGGVFALLDDECALGKGSDAGFLEKVVQGSSSHRSFVKETLWKTAFAIKHYAGTVKYEVENFLIKNKDMLKDALKLLFRTSQCPVVSIIVPEPVEKKGGRAPTTSAIFVQQIQSLMDMINSTNPHWIRCVKPHPAKKPRMMHGASSMSQLVNSGVIETVRIRQLGFPVRQPVLRFLTRFACIARAAGTPTSVNDVEGSCRKILAAAKYTPAEAQLGKTKVFMKSHIYQDIEVKKRECLQKQAILVQAHARRLLSLDILKAKLYESQKEIIEQLKKTFAKLLECGAAEAAARAPIEEEWASAHAAMEEHFKATDPAWVLRLEAIVADARTVKMGVVKDEATEWAAIRDGLANGVAAIKEEARQRRLAIAKAKKEEEDARRRAEELAARQRREEMLAEAKAKQEAETAARREAQRRRVEHAARLAAEQDAKVRLARERADAARARAIAEQKASAVAAAQRALDSQRRQDAAEKRRLEVEAAREKELLDKHAKEVGKLRAVEQAKAAWHAAAEERAILIEIEKTDDALLQLQKAEALRRRQAAIAAERKATTTLPPREAIVSDVLRRARAKETAASTSAQREKELAEAKAARLQRELWRSQQQELQAAKAKERLDAAAKERSWQQVQRYRQAVLQTKGSAAAALGATSGSVGSANDAASATGGRSPSKSAGRGRSLGMREVRLTEGELAGFVGVGGTRHYSPLVYKCSVSPRH